MGIKDAIYQEKLQWTTLRVFRWPLILSAEDGIDDSFKTLIEFTDKGLDLRVAEPGYLGYDCEIDLADVRIALAEAKRLEWKKLEAEDRGQKYPLNPDKLLVPVDIGKSDAHSVYVGDLFVNQENIRQIYAAYDEERYPWPKFPPSCFAAGQEDWAWHSTAKKYSQFTQKSLKTLTFL